MKRKYHIQTQDLDGSWRTDLQLCEMSKSFAKGAFAALKKFRGGDIRYRLIEGGYVQKSAQDSDVTIIDEFHSGNLTMGRFRNFDDKFNSGNLTTGTDLNSNE